MNPAIKQVKYFAQYPTYSLNLINDTFKYDTPEFIHNYRIVYDKDTHQVIEGLHFTFIELPKFTPHSVADKRMMVLWLRFLTEIDEDTQEIPSELLKDPEIGKAIEELEIFDFTDVELRVYDKFWDSVSVERTLLDDSYQKGLEAGRKEAELNKVLQIARNLLNLGLSISEIIEITDLTQEQIEHLKES